jgi:hypothetical protein
VSDADRLATRLLLIARDRTSGRLTNPTGLDIGLRAALLADLLLAGHIVGNGRGPVPVDTSVPEDRLLAAVQATVARRPGLAWRRWYRHVRVDREALIAELVDSGRWQSFGRLVPTYLDLDPAAADRDREHVVEVLGLRRDPADARDAVLAAIAGICGATGQPRRRARALDRELAPLLRAMNTYGDRTGLDLAQCLRAAARSTKRQLLRRRSEQSHPGVA